MENWNDQDKSNGKIMKEMLDLSKKYNKILQDEQKTPPEKLAILNVGKIDAKRRLEENVEKLMTSNIVQCLGAMLDIVVF